VHNGVRRCTVFSKIDVVILLIEVGIIALAALFGPFRNR
jgi:hypothetical protein